MKSSVLAMDSQARLPVATSESFVILVRHMVKGWSKLAEDER